MLYYKIINNNSKNPHWLLFIAGFTGTLETWSSCVTELLALNNYNILLIDNLGAGKSEQPAVTYTTELMATAVIEVIDYLNIHTINIVGHSLGGAIAQKIALLRPELIECLFLISSFAKVSNVGCYLLKSRYQQMEANIDKTVIALSAIPTIFSDSYLDDADNVKFAIERILMNPQNLQGMYGQLEACIKHNTLNALSNMSCNTTIISGEEDILVSPNHSKILHKKIKNSNLVFIRSAAHMLQLEEPKRLAVILHEKININ